MDIIRLDNTDSTNNYAKMNIDNFSDKTIIYAMRQTSGRGRLNRSWVDLGEGNLFMSIVLKPTDTFNNIYSNITQYLSVCLCNILETYGVKPEIKWPNDVLINGKKIAGILSESIVQGQHFKGLIVGIGVNLNATRSAIDAIPDKIATSLNLEIGKDIDLEDFLQKLVNEFFKNYEEFLKTGFSYIKDNYINRNCFLNKEISVQIFNNKQDGLAKELTDNGELVLQTKEKELVLTIGDIL